MPSTRPKEISAPNRALYGTIWYSSAKFQAPENPTEKKRHPIQTVIMCFFELYAYGITWVYNIIHLLAMARP